MSEQLVEWVRGGLVVTVPSFFFDDPSLNPSIFLFKVFIPYIMPLDKKGNKRKESEMGTL